MNAYTAFEHRREELERQLAQAKSLDEALACCTMALEQTACELAQDEQDEHARQRQQAVMALARRAPQLLRGVSARGELVITQAEETKDAQLRDALRKGARLVGVGLLASLAVHEVIDGQAVFALLQLLGSALVLFSGTKRRGIPLDERCSARGVALAQAKEMVRLIGEICQAADICVSDLMILEQEEGVTRLSGSADDAMIDLLVSLMEAKASGRNDLAMRSLSQAEQYLRMLGVEVVMYDEAHAGLFDILPTMGEARTIRPALMQDGRLIRRGTAARSMNGMRANGERGMGV